MFLSLKNTTSLKCKTKAMRNLLTTMLILTLSLKGFSQENETVSVTIEFEITKHNKGTILLALYNSNETYMKKSYKSFKQLVKDNKAVFVLNDLNKGTYSFSYFHDVNGNKKLDKNFIGIPKEPYGFSNNKKGRFGPPSFKDSNIQIDKDTTINISIK